MTQKGLDWHGRPANRLVGGMLCANMTMVLLFWLAMNVSAAFMLCMEWERDRATGKSYAALVLFNVGFFVHLVNLTLRIRGALCNKYQISEERCGGWRTTCVQRAAYRALFARWDGTRPTLTRTAGRAVPAPGCPYI